MWLLDNFRNVALAKYCLTWLAMQRNVLSYTLLSKLMTVSGRARPLGKQDSTSCQTHQPHVHRSIHQGVIPRSSAPYSMSSLALNCRYANTDNFVLNACNIPDQRICGSQWKLQPRLLHLVQAVPGSLAAQRASMACNTLPWIGAQALPQ